MYRLCLVGAFICGAVCLSACDEKLSTVTGPTPDLAPTFTSIQRDIFEATDSSGRTSCVTCHTNTGGHVPSGGLNLNHDVAYDQLVSIASREKPATSYVLPGNSANSYLFQKLNGSTGIVGVRMPQNGPPYLTDGQILVIQRWIDTGASRN